MLNYQHIFLLAKSKPVKQEVSHTVILPVTNFRHANIIVIFCQNQTNRCVACLWGNFAANIAFVLHSIPSKSYALFVAKKWQKVPENTHHWGMYHRMAGLQFYKFGFSCFTTSKNNIFSSLVKSSIVKLETICTVILSPTVSVLWCGQPSVCLTFTLKDFS